MSAIDPDSGIPISSLPNAPQRNPESNQAAALGLNLSTEADPVSPTSAPALPPNPSSLPAMSSARPTPNAAEKWENTFGPRTKWRHGICDFFDIICCTPLCLMSTCGLTHTMLVGQLMERMGLDWCGQYDPWQAHNTCRTVTIIWLLYCCLYFAGISFLIWPFISIWLIVLTMRLRGAVRNRHSISPEYCQGCNGHLEDCLCACCCGCCSAIQIARQTHDEQRYPYNFSSNTGLPSHAPLVFEHPMPEEMQERGSTRPPLSPSAAATSPEQQQPLPPQPTTPQPAAADPTTPTITDPAAAQPLLMQANEEEIVVPPPNDGAIVPYDNEAIQTTEDPEIVVTSTNEGAIVPHSEEEV